MTDDVRMDYVFTFTDRRDEVTRFYRDVVGLSAAESDDSEWFRAGASSFVVHEREDRETAPEVASGSGFVVWFRVGDVRAAYDRARAAGRVVGELYDAKPYPYFFARDPDGRFVGVGSIERDGRR